VHGTAPDIAGQDLANPVAAILSSVLMLRHLGEGTAASRVQHAVETAVGKGGEVTLSRDYWMLTTEVTQAIIAALKARRRPHR
jgi:isocitrate/isopropylmalate dehydrogenase